MGSADGGPSATAATAAAQASGAGTGQKQRRILVVEDDAAILRQIEFHLQSHGYMVETATTGVEAIKAMMARRPDLLITDVMMPEMDGHELAMSVRADPELKDVPIIMLTARTQDEDMMQGYQSGTDLYLTKPFNLDELITFVRRIVG